MFYVVSLYGPTGKRHIGYAVVKDGAEVERFTNRKCGYWRWAKRDAYRLAEALNSTQET